MSWLSVRYFEFAGTTIASYSRRTLAIGVEARRLRGDLFEYSPPVIAIPVTNAASGLPLISWKAPSPTDPPAPGLNVDVYSPSKSSAFNVSLIALLVSE